MAFARTDPAERDARTQFYIAYSYYRQGWGRLYHDDALYTEGLAAIDRALALAPGGRLVIEDEQPADADRRRAQSGARGRPPPRRVGLQSDARIQGAEVTGAIREAVVLPAALLTVLLLGSVRIGETTTIAPPSVFALVLALLLVRVVVQSGALAPERLVGASRSALANAQRDASFFSLWLAAAQVVAVLTPVSGLPRIVGGVFLLVLLLNTAAAAPDRARLLRSLAITFGALFLLKFVVLLELSAPGTSRLKACCRQCSRELPSARSATAIPSPRRATWLCSRCVLFLVGVLLLPRGYPGTSGWRWNVRNR